MSTWIRQDFRLKSHDCHVLLQRLLPAGIRKFLKKEIRDTIIELCVYFKQLCSRTLHVSDLEKMQTNILTILCKLETIFPPAFFDIMVHVVMHLPKEAILGGPVQYRWMYPIERSMSVYKQYVRNRARPEGSIAESFVVNEALTFCSMYFREVETRFNRPDRNNDIVQNMPTRQFSVFKHVGRPIGMRTVDTLPMQSKRKAEWYILNNCTEVEPYINEHKELLQARGVGNIETVQETEFPEWFKTQINELRLTNQGAVSDELYAIANPANTAIYFYPGCIVNGIKFLVKERDDNRKTQNSGVMWFDTNGSRMDSDGVITSICVNRQWYQNEPFILASQAKLIYYIPDLKNGKDWLIVNEYIPRNVWDFPDTDGETPFVQENNSIETEFVVQLPQLDDVDYVRHDVDPTKVANIHLCLHQSRSSRKKGVRGKYKGKNVEEELSKTQSAKLPIEVHAETGTPVGKNGKKFNNMAKWMTRMSIPINKFKWEDVSRADINALWDRLETKFILPRDNPTFVDYGEYEMSKGLRDWRADCKKKWIQNIEELGQERADMSPPEGVTQEVWTDCIAYWSTDKQKVHFLKF
ncbi:uncharacterized protein LOC133036997 [Cannabis sativa]|uniref:uncharacterized protein LOC133036997 n=1 Tax=Cannabis sativa TaxID=3483 RepID=UPI0029C9BC20|nr:uncharacterized protein LOC133036997 [Cannabis sativa]